jgi:hypothetical protein
MASGNRYEMSYYRRREVVLLGAKFYPQGAGTPLLDTDPPDTGNAYPVAGRPVRTPGIASVSRTSAGLFVVTLSDKFAGLITAAGPDLHLHSLTQLTAQFTGVDVAGAKTVGIQVLNPSTGVATDIAAAADNWISFLLVLANSPTN